MKLKSLYLVIMTLPFFALPSYAENLSDALAKCSKIENSLKRLVCYDRLSQTAKGYTDSQLPTVLRNPADLPNKYQSQSQSQTQTSAVNQQPRSAEENFGLPPAAQITTEQPDSLSAVIQDVSKTSRGKLIITLQNGQVWRQTDSASTLLKAGDSVEIESGLFGSFFMKKADSSRTIKVKRSK